MQRAQKLKWDTLAGWCLVMLISAAAARAEDKTLVEWRFDKAGDFRGWQVGGLIADAAVRDGRSTAGPLAAIRSCSARRSRSRRLPRSTWKSA